MVPKLTNQFMANTGFPSVLSNSKRPSSLDPTTGSKRSSSLDSTGEKVSQAFAKTRAFRWTGGRFCELGSCAVSIVMTSLFFVKLFLRILIPLVACCTIIAPILFFRSESFSQMLDHYKHGTCDDIAFLVMSFFGIFRSTAKVVVAPGEKDLTTVDYTAKLGKALFRISSIAVQAAGQNSQNILNELTLGQRIRQVVFA